MGTFPILNSGRHIGNPTQGSLRMPINIQPKGSTNHISYSLYSLDLCAKPSYTLYILMTSRKRKDSVTYSLVKEIPKAHDLIRLSECS